MMLNKSDARLHIGAYLKKVNGYSPSNREIQIITDNGEQVIASVGGKTYSFRYKMDIVLADVVETKADSVNK